MLAQVVGHAIKHPRLYTVRRGTLDQLRELTADLPDTAREVRDLGIAQLAEPAPTRWWARTPDEHMGVHDRLDTLLEAAGNHPQLLGSELTARPT